MRILTYKRTHIGDPDANGCFGINGCMGQVRGYKFDAVIGVGGIGWEPKSYGIDRKINWVGFKPYKQKNLKHGGVLVKFKKFILLEYLGPILRVEAPKLAQRMYGKGARILLKSYSEEEQQEAENIIYKWLLSPHAQLLLKKHAIKTKRFNLTKKCRLRVKDRRRCSISSMLKQDYCTSKTSCLSICKY